MQKRWVPILIGLFISTGAVLSFAPNKALAQTATPAPASTRASNPNTGTTVPENCVQADGNIRIYNIEPCLKDTPNTQANFPWIITTWRWSLGVVNAFAVIVLILMAFSNILTPIQFLQPYRIKQLLPTFVYGIILANLSLFVCRAIISASDVLMSTGGLRIDGLSALYRAWGFDPSLLHYGILQSKFGGNVSLTSVSGTIYRLVVSTVLVYFPIIMMVALAFVFYMRFGVIFICTAVAPLAFGSIIFPATRQYLNKWWAFLWQWAFGGLASFLLIRLAAQIKPSATSTAGFAIDIIPYAIDTVLIYYAIVTPFKVASAFGLGAIWGGIGNRYLANPAKKTAGWVAKKTGQTAAWAAGVNEGGWVRQPLTKAWEGGRINRAYQNTFVRPKADKKAEIEDIRKSNQADYDFTKFKRLNNEQDKLIQQYGPDEGKKRFEKQYGATNFRLASNTMRTAGRERTDNYKNMSPEKIQGLMEDRAVKLGLADKLDKSEVKLAKLGKAWRDGDKRVSRNDWLDIYGAMDQLNNQAQHSFIDADKATARAVQRTLAGGEDIIGKDLVKLPVLTGAAPATVEEQTKVELEGIKKKTGDKDKKEEKTEKTAAASVAANPVYQNTSAESPRTVFANQTEAKAAAVGDYQKFASTHTEFSNPVLPSNVRDVILDSAAGRHLTTNDTPEQIAQYIKDQISTNTGGAVNLSDQTLQALTTQSIQTASRLVGQNNAGLTTGNIATQRQFGANQALEQKTSRSVVDSMKERDKILSSTLEGLLKKNVNDIKASDLESIKKIVPTGSAAQKVLNGSEDAADRAGAVREVREMLSGVRDLQSKVVVQQQSVETKVATDVKKMADPTVSAADRNAAKAALVSEGQKIIAVTGMQRGASGVDYVATAKNLNDKATVGKELVAQTEALAQSKLDDGSRQQHLNQIKEAVAKQFSQGHADRITNVTEAQNVTKEIYEGSLAAKEIVTQAGAAQAATTDVADFKAL